MSTQLVRTAWQDLLTGHSFTGPASAGLPGRTAARPTGRLSTAPAARHWLTWRRLSPGLELVTLGAAYAAPSVVRLALPAAKHAAFAHAAELYHAEQQVHLNVEPYLNHLVSSHAVLAMLTGYYYGTLHFILTPLIVAWLYLSATARDATATRLAEADLDAVPVTEAIARVARVVASGGSKYAAFISRFGALDTTGDAEQQIGTMLRALLQRGIDDGTFRGDLSVTELLFLFGQLLQAAARMTAEHVAGVEKAAALVTSVFLHGTQRRQDETADEGEGRPVS